MEFIIRKATTQDLNELGQLGRELDVFNRETLQLYLDDPIPPVENYQALAAKQLANKDYLILVAEVDGNVVGYALGELYHDELEGKLYAHAEEIYVQPEYRGQGIGKALSSKREELLKAAGALGIGTEIFDNNQASLQLHLREGYKVQSKVINLFKDF